MQKFAVGQAIRRLEDERFLTGQGQYIDDLVFDRMAHAVVLRSPHAHARIRSIDVDEAKMVPGVLAIFTHADIAAAVLGPIPTVTTIDGVDDNGIRIPPRHALTGDVVHFVGEPVAFIVAETRARALEASELVFVDYEDLPAVVDVERTLDDDAPVLWPQFGSNVCYRFHRGDREATSRAFTEAAHVVSITVRNNRLSPAPLETRGVIGDWNAEAEQYVLYVSGQSVHSQKAHLAREVFKVPGEQVRLIAPDVGGGFGAKNFTYPENVMVLFAARALGRPVKWVADRSENFVAETHGRDQVATAELALDENARFMALRVNTVANMGACLSTNAPIIPSAASVAAMGGPYEIPAISFDVTAVFTNTTPVDAYRGAGRPEATYLMERVVEMAARQLGLASDEIRRRNFMTRFPYKTALGSIVDCGAFEENLDRAQAAIDWAGFEARREAAVPRGRLLGRGISCYLEATLGPPSEEAEIRFDEDGGVTLLVGTHSTGQGHETVYAQIVATGLAIPVERIRFVQGDTGLVATGGGHGGSRSLAIGGSAMAGAIQEVREKARLAATNLLEVAAGDIEFENGRFTIAGTDRSIGLLEIEEKLRGAKDLPEGMPRTLTSRIGFSREGISFPNGCHIAEVAIDADTGHVALTRYCVVDDFGRILNPMLAGGQVAGGIAQGVGQALCECVVYDPESGQLMTGSLMDYCLPRADDLSAFEIAFNEDVPTATNPLGVKGAGEAGATGAPPAIVNAVYDALGLQTAAALDMPLTAETVWRAIRSGRG